MTPPQTWAAGWYTDPGEPSRQRLFDGVTWTDSTRKTPGRFAAKYAHRSAGAWLLVGGILLALWIPGTIGGIVAARTDATILAAVISLLLLILVAGGLIAWSVYLLRGKGENPAEAAQRAQRRLAAESDFRAAIDNLRQQRIGGAGVVALRHVDATAQRAFGPQAPQRAAAAIAELGIDRASFASPRLGALAIPGSTDWFEVYADWIIVGYEARDVDEHTRMSVYLDGSVQVVARQFTQGNSLVTRNEHVDMRHANVQVVSDTWSLTAPIHPDHVNEARRIADQLGRHVAKRQPQAASTADIRAMVDAILEATGQPIAEKLTQLSNLRYDRVLSDADFETAKAKLLAHPERSI